MNRLLVISRCSEPRGGADRIVSDICRELPKKGWEVELALVAGARFNLPDQYLQFHHGLVARKVDGTLGTRRCRLRALHQVVKSARPDVVLSFRVFDVYEVLASMKLGNSAAPRLAVGVRAFEAPYFFDLKRYSDFVDLCVTSGKLIARTCTDYSGLPPERVQSIPGGVAGPIAAIAGQGVVSRPVRLLYAGRLDSGQKRCLDLIPFVRSLESRQVRFHLTIAGAGPAEPMLKQELRGAVHRGMVEFLGWCSRDQLYSEVYPQCDIFVHFAAWEGVTIAPREAMAHGMVPVISQFVGQQEEGQFIDGQTALTFPVGDVDLAASLVERLVSEPEMYSMLSGNAGNSQRGRYSSEGAISAWAEALTNCMQQPCQVGKHVPHTVDRTNGRLSQLPLPACAVDWTRRLLRRPVLHQSPGSEWPTDSGQLSDKDRGEIDAFAGSAKDEGLADLAAIAGRVSP